MVRIGCRLVAGGYSIFIPRVQDPDDDGQDRKNVANVEPILRNAIRERRRAAVVGNKKRLSKVNLEDFWLAHKYKKAGQKDRHITKIRLLLLFLLHVCMRWLGSEWRSDKDLHSIGHPSQRMHANANHAISLWEDCCVANIQQENNSILPYTLPLHHCRIPNKTFF